jgi:hypothetical protein
MSLKRRVAAALIIAVIGTEDEEPKVKKIREKSWMERKYLGMGANLMKGVVHIFRNHHRCGYFVGGASQKRKFP